MVLETEHDTDSGTRRVSSTAWRRDATARCSCAWSKGVSRRGRDAHGARSCVSTTARSFLGCVGSTVRGKRWPGPTALELQTPVEAARRRPEDHRRVHGEAPRAVCVRARLVSVARSPTRPEQRSALVDLAHRPSTGGTGRPAAATRASGASRCCDRCSRSSRSRTSPPAASSPRPPPRCPRRSAARATGTTATAGYATRRSRSKR